MIQVETLFSTIASELEPTLSKLGFTVIKPEGLAKGELPLFTRDTSTYLAYQGDKGKLRILFNDNKIRLLTASKDSVSEDDSDYTLIASLLFILDEYEKKDLKSTVNELIEELEDRFSPKQLAKQAQNIKMQATVSRSDVKSGSVFYDPATLAVRLAGMYPQLKEQYKEHMALYGEFLCEDFFVNCVNPLVFETIKEGSAQKMKKLFGILNEIYEDGTNEVQDVIVVTMLASYDYTGDMQKRVIEHVSDTILEPFIRVNSILKKSKSMRMRLEHPPAYKPKKQKKKKSPIPRLIEQ